LYHVFSHRIVVFVLNVNIRKTLRNRVSSTGGEDTKEEEEEEEMEAKDP